MPEPLNKTPTAVTIYNKVWFLPGFVVKYIEELLDEIGQLRDDIKKLEGRTDG